ncbi:hypothetical protein BT96DRAFT_994317 [Gymnopus androsaceus JB14]|nr:hypothetical protein BT96DRAFT_994317 [Gymnopus androsaceus JB14]
MDALVFQLLLKLSSAKELVAKLHLDLQTDVWMLKYYDPIKIIIEMDELLGKCRSYLQEQESLVRELQHLMQNIIELHLATTSTLAPMDLD